MYLMYVDESGDTGLVNSPTQHFALSGLVVHESGWRPFVTAMASFRKTMRAAHGLPLRHEIHAAEYIRSAPVAGMPRRVRLAILRNLLDEIGKLNYVSITNVVVQKKGKTQGYDVFQWAWQILFQRFQNTLQYGNFPGGNQNDNGIVFTDATDGKKLTKLVRKMGAYNPVPHMAQFGAGYRQLPAVRLIEDPIPKDSRDSYFVQACDTCAYFLRQSFAPNRFIRRHGGQYYMQRLKPVLNVKAARHHPLGIVIL
jgi:hypothetical protein